MARKFGENLGEFFHEAFNSTFFLKVLNNKYEIEEDLEIQYDKFFRDMAAMVGGQSAPRQLGVSWADISQSWDDRKVKAGVTSNPGDNAFYRGLTAASNSYHAELRNLNTREIYGDIRVNIGSVKAQGAFGKGSSRRTVRTDLNRLSTKGNVLRYGGSFASIDNFFNTSLGFDAFEYVKSAEDVLDGLPERVELITGVNEGLYGTKGGHGITRPFMIPMMKYYTDVVLKDVFIKSVNKR